MPESADGWVLGKASSCSKRKGSGSVYVHTLGRKPHGRCGALEVTQRRVQSWFRDMMMVI